MKKQRLRPPSITGAWRLVRKLAVQRPTRFLEPEPSGPDENRDRQRLALGFVGHGGRAWPVGRGLRSGLGFC